MTHFPFFKKAVVAGVCISMLGQMQWALAQSTSYAVGACHPVPGSQTCVDSTPCKTDANGKEICLSTASPPAGAYQIANTCWQYAYEYACQGDTVDTCTTYKSDPSCGLTKSECSDVIAETGLCDEYTDTYTCQTADAQTSQQTVCSTGLFDTSAFTTPANTNNSFLTGALGMEILGEAQTYTDGNSIFAGVKEGCRKGYFGIQNCCKSEPGAQSNSVVMTTALGAAGSVAKYAGEKAVDLASPYVFDAMYTNGIFTEALQKNFTLPFSLASSDGGGGLGTSLSSGGLSIGAYGLTIGTGTMGAGLFGGNIALATWGGADGALTGYLAFNPYTFAIAVAIQVIMNLMKCSQAEMMLSMHKGANLSTYVGEECSKSVLGVCLQYTDEYCSFNSQLAEIINIQGKTQLGLDVSDCAGISATQLSSIDFTKIDFSAFTAQIEQQAVSNLPTNISTTYTTIEQNTTSGSSQSPTSTVLHSY